MFITPEIQALVEKTAKLLVERNEFVAVSENCCGGLISSYLVSVNGASQFFVGGTTTYALRSRLVLSGWSEADVASYTGPSEEVALRLARNLKFELGATYTLAETGWTGRHETDGWHMDDGEAFFAISGPAENVSRTVTSNTDDRQQNMEWFAQEALRFLLETIEKRANNL
ncbi:hypothetical protein DASB73_037410 [Starmerella bacillaris]|uniref:CinA C-terminal domain-containing protein n=1 Tax=Starmerella bacillaris TaxID=1247836 RepID=A0AAV5RNP7_STABA|nr:hypothetical protein DASB73_037410 [Starmerella bacillaris]